MQTRRTIVVSMLGAVTFAGIAGVADAASSGDDDLPKAVVIKGKPPILDFGDGLRVPCDKGAFLTLWESPTFWLTFGFGTASISDIAKSRAVYHAIGAMRYLLLTLAFAPQRLKSADGHGWRQKEEMASNYVMGDLEVPGRPSRALDDLFLGRGNVDATFFWGDTNVGGYAAVNPGQAGGPEVGATGMMPSLRVANVNAFCCYVVMKKDLSLDDVRNRARIL
jgi:hypothetical protein